MNPYLRAVPEPDPWQKPERQPGPYSQFQYDAALRRAGIEYGKFPGLSGTTLQLFLYACLDVAVNKRRSWDFDYSAEQVRWAGYVSRPSLPPKLFAQELHWLYPSYLKNAEWHLNLPKGLENVAEEHVAEYLGRGTVMPHALFWTRFTAFRMYELALWSDDPWSYLDMELRLRRGHATINRGGGWLQRLGLYEHVGGGRFLSVLRSPEELDVIAEQEGVAQRLEALRSRNVERIVRKDAFDEKRLLQPSPIGGPEGQIAHQIRTGHHGIDGVFPSARCSGCGIRLGA